jgi:hypothetical protein
MTNKTEEKVESVEQVNETKVVSEAVQKVLEEHGYGIQPFIIYSEFGITPSARLVKIPNDETTDSGEVEGDTEQDGTTGTESA